MTNAKNDGQEQEWSYEPRLRAMVRCAPGLVGGRSGKEKKAEKNETDVELSKLRYHELKVVFFFCFVCRQLPGRRNGIIDNRETLMKPKIK